MFLSMALPFAPILQQVSRHGTVTHNPLNQVLQYAAKNKYPRQECLQYKLKLTIPKWRM